MLWSIHFELRHSLNHDSKEWHQPPISNILSPKLISPEEWSFNFELTEKILSQSKLNKNKDLLINSQLTDVLIKATTSLPENLNNKQLQRVEFLTSNILPNKAGTQLASLFNNYYQLDREINTKTETKQGSSNLEDEILKFETLTALQKKYLGREIAARFYGKKIILTEYLYGRRKINQNTDLSDNKKIKNLNELQIKFKHIIKNYQHASQ
jgi:lipase chaperone LimK